MGKSEDFLLDLPSFWEENSSQTHSDYIPNSSGTHSSRRALLPLAEQILFPELDVGEETLLQISFSSGRKNIIKSTPYIFV